MAVKRFLKSSSQTSCVLTLSVDRRTAEPTPAYLSGKLSLWLGLISLGHRHSFPPEGGAAARVGERVWEDVMALKYLCPSVGGYDYGNPSPGFIGLLSH